MNLPFIRLASSFLLLALSMPLWASVVEYGQKLNEADWNVISTSKRCVMSQDIPLYGSAEFEQLFRDKGLSFSITVNSIPANVINAKLTAVPPKWNHVTLLRPIAKVNLQTSNKALILENKLAMRLIAELEDGMFPTLSYQSWTDENHNIVVAVSPINFRERIPKFLACITKLPLKPIVVKPKPKPVVKPKPKPIKITKIADDPNPNTLYFAANSAKLDSKSKKKLKTLAKKLKLDKKNKHIIVSGYSDDVGNKTQSTAISKQRALNVQSYLEKQGIPAKTLFTRYFGRDHAILSNSTKKGRAKNRRVHIDVIHSNLKSAR
ncbi:MAG: OmpA family protein [Gammaproteobacteria bacterium]